MDVLVFPNVRAALSDLLDGSTHYDPSTGETVTVTAVSHLQSDGYGALIGPFPLVQVFVPGGTQSFVDRVDRARLEVYAPGEQAVNVLESIRAFICGTNIDTPSGFLDGIEPDVTPSESAYYSDTLNQATATFLVTSRPIN